MTTGLELTRERLESLQRILRRNPQGITLRNLLRCHWMFRHEVEEAAKLGFVTLTKRQPHTGRPSTVVALSVNKPCASKLPPFSWQLGSHVSFRHWRFALETLSIGPSRNCIGWGLQSKASAYRKVYPRAKYSSARAGACRLMKHPDVKACRHWYFAVTNNLIPAGESFSRRRCYYSARLERVKAVIARTIPINPAGAGSATANLYLICIRFLPQMLANDRIPSLALGNLKSPQFLIGGCFQRLLMEARAGIEPAHTGFADQCITTLLPRHCSLSRVGV